MKFVFKTRRFFRRVLDGRSQVRLARMRAYILGPCVVDIFGIHHASSGSGAYVRFWHPNFRREMYVWAEIAPHPGRPVRVTYAPKAEERLRNVYGYEYWQVPAGYLRAT